MKTRRPPAIGPTLRDLAEPDDREVERRPGPTDGELQPAFPGEVALGRLLPASHVLGRAALQEKVRSFSVVPADPGVHVSIKRVGRREDAPGPGDRLLYGSPAPLEYCDRAAPSQGAVEVLDAVAFQPLLEPLAGELDVLIGRGQVGRGCVMLTTVVQGRTRRSS